MSTIIQVPAHVSPLNFAMVFIGTHFDGPGLVFSLAAFTIISSIIFYALWDGAFRFIFNDFINRGYFEWFNPKTWFHEDTCDTEWDRTNKALHEKARLLIQNDDVNGAAKVFEALEIHSKSKPVKKGWFK